MPLPKQNLDNKTYHQLVEEAKALIPRYAPQWTDHNWSDPGVTFIDLFAWLTEIVLYRINSVTDDHYRKYLKLLGIRPELQRPAMVDLTFESNREITLKAGEKVSAKIDSAYTAIDFELNEDITILPLELQKVFVDANYSGVFDRTDANQKADLFFFPFGLYIRKDCALYLGFGQSSGNQDKLSINQLSFMCYLYEKDMIDGAPGKHGDEPDYKFKNAKLEWQFSSEADWEDIFVEDGTDGFKKDGRIIFERMQDWKLKSIPIYPDKSFFWLRCIVRYSHFEYPPRIENIILNTVSATQGMTIKGEHDRTTDDFEKRHSSGLPHWLFKLDSAPVLDKSMILSIDEDFAEYLFTWTEIPGKDSDKLICFLKNKFCLDWAKYAIKTDENTIKISSKNESILLKLENDKVMIEGFSCELTARMRNGKPEVYDSDEFLFTWTEVPGKDSNRLIRFLRDKFCLDWAKYATKIAENTIKISPEEKSVLLKLEKDRVTIGNFSYKFIVKMEDGKPDIYHSIWTEVDDFDSSGPEDNHYVIDNEKGEVKFGNGLYGRVPPSGAIIEIIRYRTGGGEVGNLKIGCKWETKHNDLVISNRKASEGGKDAKSTEEAVERLLKDLKVPYTSVTSHDYEYIAKNTPGLRVSKAKAIPNYPFENEGCVTVVVIPYIPPIEELETSKPVSSEEFKYAVCRHLDKHRLLGTRIQVQDPVYIRVYVSATIVPLPGFSDEGLRKNADEKLRKFLHPIKGWKDGSGWPIGGNVYRSDIYDILEKIEGVDCVIKISLSGEGGLIPDVEGNLILKSKTMTVVSGTHLITISRDPNACRKGRKTNG